MGTSRQRRNETSKPTLINGFRPNDKSATGNATVVREAVDVSGERAGAFEEALSNIGVGGQIVYHVGEYCAGAHKRCARSAYECGLVTLSLRKRSKYLFEYIAIKTAKGG